MRNSNEMDIFNDELKNANDVSKSSVLPLIQQNLSQNDDVSKIIISTDANMKQSIAGFTPQDRDLQRKSSEQGLIFKNSNKVNKVVDEEDAQKIWEASNESLQDVNQKDSKQNIFYNNRNDIKGSYNSTMEQVAEIQNPQRNRQPNQKRSQQDSLDREKTRNENNDLKGVRAAFDRYENKGKDISSELEQQMDTIVNEQNKLTNKNTLDQDQNFNPLKVLNETKFQDENLDSDEEQNQQLTINVAKTIKKDGFKGLASKATQGWANAGEKKIKNLKKASTIEEFVSLGQFKNKKLAGLDFINNKQSMTASQEVSLTELQKSDENMDESGFGFGMSGFGVTQDKEERADLRKIFIQNFGIEMEIPTYYIVNAKFVPHVRDHIVVMAYHIMPKEYSQTIQTTYFDGSVIEESFSEIERNAGKSMIIKLQRGEGRNGFKTINEIVLRNVKDAIMEFSKNGKFFAIYMRDEQVLNVFQALEVEKCFEDIAEQKTYIKHQFSDSQMNDGQRIIFDKDENFVSVISETQVVVISLHENEKGKVRTEYKLDESVYSHIYDAVIDSSKTDSKDSFELYLAAKLFGLTNIHIIDAIKPKKDGKINVKYNLAYLKKGLKIMVRISDNLNKVLFTNGQEHYILNNGHQDIIESIKEKFIRHVINYKNSFYLVTSKDYDRDIDIIHAEHKDENYYFDRFIEPGLLQCYDSNVVEDLNDFNKERNVMQTLMKIGDQLYMDSLDVEMNKIEDINLRASAEYFSGSDMNRKSFSTRKTVVLEQKDAKEAIDIKDEFEMMDINNEGRNSDVIISKVKKQYDTARKSVDFKNPDLDSFNTDDSNDFHIGMCVEKHYSAQAFNWPYFSFGDKNNFVYIYNAFNPTFVQRYQMPKNVTVICSTFLTDTHDFFILCETVEAEFKIFTVNLDHENPKLNSLFKYPFSSVKSKYVIDMHVRGSSSKEKINLNKILMCFMLHGNELYAWKDGQVELIPIDKEVSNLYYLSDDVIFYKTTEEIEMHHKKVEHSKIYMISCEFGNFEKTMIYQDRDPMAEILNFSVDNTRKRLLILTGKKNMKNKRDKFITIFDIEKETLLYSMQIKNREIIGRLKSNLYNFVEGHIYYGNKVIKIRYDLIDKQEGHVIKEEQLFDHYSEILGLQSHEHVQSGTPLQTCLYNKLAYIIRQTKKLKPRRLLILPYLHERRIYLNRRHTTNQFYTIMQYGEGPNKRDFIVCFCFNDSKLYVYTETGILIKRVIYKAMSENCGKPVTVSEDGSYFIFRKSSSSEYMNLIKFDLDGILKPEGQEDSPTLIKNINIIETIRNEMKSQTNEEMIHFYEVILQKLDKDKNVLKYIDVNYCLNDNGDVLVRLKPKQHYLEKRVKQLQDIADFDDGNHGIHENIHHCSMFYFEGNDNQNKYGKYMYYDSPLNEIVNMQGVSMNQKYIFFWNLGKVWKLNLLTKEILQLSLYVSEQEIRTKVIKVRTMSSPDLIIIRIEQSPQEHCVVMWDLQKNKELDSFDISHDALFFQDKDGSPFLAEKDYVVNCDQGCKTKCYSFNVSDFDTENCTFSFNYGLRVESKTLNWVILRNFINLSFSYMTFVIKDNFDNLGFVVDDFVFDIEGYDYILNRNNIFTEGNLVTQQFEKLQFILQNYEQLDPNLLESLHFQNRDNKMPLHIAQESKNNRMVNLIIEYMSKIDYAALKHFDDILWQLISYSNFETYMIEAPFQTIQMQNKQTILLKEKEEDEIIITQSTGCSYIDEDYFEHKMGEDKKSTNSITYSIKFFAIRTDFIINDESGYRFLKEMLRLKRMNLFNTNYMMLLTQFLYKNYSRKIIKMLLPYYIIHQISMSAYVVLIERLRDEKVTANSKEGSLGISDEIKESVKIQNYVVTAFLWIMVVTTAVNVYFLCNQIKNMKLQFLKRMWSYVDVAIIILNLIVIINELFTSSISVENSRVIESLLMIFLWFKSLYYLGMVGEIAPLIDIIFVIINDIKYFLVVYIICLIAFMNSFYLIGKNQEGYGTKDVVYSTLFGSMIHIYESSLGNFSTDTYFEDAMWPWLLLFFLLLTVGMLITLLNMLIAIMGETFSKNSEIAESKKRLSQLSFVVENWWIDPIPNKEDIVYIIGGFQVNDDQNNDHRLDELKHKVDFIHAQTQNKLEDLMHTMQTIQQSINSQALKQLEDQDHCNDHNSHKEK